MAHWFEDLTKQMADEKIGRRTAIRRVAGTVTGVTLASAIPGAVLAKKKACPIGGNCTIGFKNCQGTPNSNCFCWTGINGKGKCACNTFCNGLNPCASEFNCAKGYTCVTLNGCTGCGSTSGICLPKCKGKNKNCQLGSGHGLTAAHRLS